MKPYPTVPDFSAINQEGFARAAGFDLDKYLDENHAAPPTRFVISEGDRTMRVSGLTPEQARSFQGIGRHGFRTWALRLNNRIENWMDRCDWGRISIWIGNLGGVFLTGAAFYLFYVVIDAWLQGRFNLGGR